MLLMLAQWLQGISPEFGFLRVFQYLTLRAVLAAVTALLIGLLVRPASAVLAFTMLVAMFTVHFSHGLFMSNNGYEYALSLLAVSVSLLISGAGNFSLDNVLAERKQ